MALPAPNLDDRRFQDLVDDAKRMVQQRCPEWSDHNVSDPGVTLIETFAFMVDQLLYRLNRVPDRNYVKFLELIGVQLFPPVAARAPVTFWLSAPTPSPVTINVGVEVATVRTETDQAVVFRVDEPLDIVPCDLVLLRSQTAAGTPRAGSWRDHGSTLSGGPGLASFSDVPAVGDALYVGLSHPVPRCAVAIRLDCHIEGIGVDPERPPLRWEAYDGADWLPCEVEKDTTGGLNKPGDVVLHVPAEHASGIVNGEAAGWIRGVVTAPTDDRPAYSSSPMIDAARAFTIGGTTSAVHAELVEGETLGVSNGAAAQRFPVEHGPVVPQSGQALVEVADPDTGEGWVEWMEVDTFASSSETDRHVIFDRRAGEIQFGPAVRQADGHLRQYGAVPAKGSTIRIPAYATGGGSSGNVSKGALTVLRRSIPYVSRVENRWAAAGGVDGETVDEAKIRGPIVLRTRNRAVTAEDYEELAREAAPEVARVRCVAATGPGEEGGARVLVVPAAEGDERGRLRFDQLIPAPTTLSRIRDYLDERRVLGSRISVEPPKYQALTVVARVRAYSRVRATDVEQAAMAALYRYYDPIRGGPDRRGWPFGRPLHVGEIFAVLQGVPGIDYVLDARLFAADPITGERGDAVSQIALDPNSLVFSYEHLLRVEQ